MNTIIFLKNYNQFAFRVRLDTALCYLEKMNQTTDISIKKVMMLRITEELLNSTEDLTMWLSAFAKRNNFQSMKNASDVWEYMLLCFASDKFVNDNLASFTRARTTKGLMKKMNVSIEELAEFGKIDATSLEELMAKLLETIKGAQNNRTASRGVLLRFQNKIKHGMMVLDDGSKLYIRDLKIKKYKKNRNLELPLNEVRAEKMVGTVKANCYAVKNIITLFLLHYATLLKASKKPLSKKDQKFWAEAINYTIPSV